MVAVSGKNRARPPIVCVTGMHRSGSSLMASYLHVNGINMGETLVGPDKGNELGHWEDRDFVNFHGGLLNDNSSHLLSPRKPLVITPDRRAEGRGLLDKRKEKFQSWGWKDPRTSLFLDFWANEDPTIRFVLLYRDPNSVVDSLFRRGTDRCLTIMPWRAAEAWIRYNQELLNFFRAHESRAILINISGFNRDPQTASSLLEKFSDTKIAVPYSEIYDPTRISGPAQISKKIRNKVVAAVYLKKFAELYADLEMNANIPGTPAPEIL